MFGHAAPSSRSAELVEPNRKEEEALLVRDVFSNGPTGMLGSPLIRFVSLQECSQFSGRIQVEAFIEL